MLATVNMDRARISRTPDGGVAIDDPDSPWLIRATAHVDNGRARLVRLRIDVRPDRLGDDVTSSRLARLPVAHILHAAAAAADDGGYPNEVYHRMLARPKPAGTRRWPDSHWPAVLQIWQWGVDVDWPGGGCKAVADLWRVAVDPTVWRWLREARQREEHPV